MSVADVADLVVIDHHQRRDLTVAEPVLHGQVLNHPQSVAASPLSPVATHLLAAEDSEAGEVPAEVEPGASADESAAEQPPAGQASPDAASAAEAPADPS